MKSRYLGMFSFLIVLALTACSSTMAVQRSGSITIDDFNKSEHGDNFFFQILVDDKMIDNGVPISIQTSGNTSVGQIHTVLNDPNGVTVWDPGAFGGEFSANTYYKPTVTGKYQLGITWDQPVKGSIGLSYQAEKLSLAAIIPGLGMMLVAVFFIVFSRRQGGTWGYLGLGSLLWVVTVAIKFIIAMAINPAVYRTLFVVNDLWAPGSLAFYIYVGALTGITEVLISWLLLRYTRLGRVSWFKALAFGVGFGAFEALLLGLASAGTMVSALVVPEAIPASAIGQLLSANNLLIGIAPIFERAGTILVHMVCAVLLFYGVQSGQARWFWVSFAWKTLLDTVAAFAQFWGVETLAKMWTIEAIVIVFGLISWWGIRKIALKYQASQPVQEPLNTPAVDIN